MRSEKRSARHLFACAAVIVSASACDGVTNEVRAHHSDGSTSAPDTGGSGLPWPSPPDGTPPTFFPSFYAVYYEVLVPNCASCHASSGYFSLGTPNLGYQTLVGVRATGTC